MNKEKMYLEKIEVLRQEIIRLNKQITTKKPTRKVGIGVKKWIKIVYNIQRDHILRIMDL